MAANKLSNRQAAIDILFYKFNLLRNAMARPQAPLDHQKLRMPHETVMPWKHKWASGKVIIAVALEKSVGGIVGEFEMLTKNVRWENDWNGYDIVDDELSNEMTDGDRHKSIWWPIDPRLIQNNLDFLIWWIPWTCAAPLMTDERACFETNKTRCWKATMSTRMNIWNFNLTEKILKHLCWWRFCKIETLNLVD